MSLPVPYYQDESCTIYHGIRYVVNCNHERGRTQTAKHREGGTVSCAKARRGSANAKAGAKAGLPAIGGSRREAEAERPGTSRMVGRRSERARRAFAGVAPL